MAIEIKAPSFPESVADGTVATWHKKPGEAVKRDDLIVELSRRGSADMKKIRGIRGMERRCSASFSPPRSPASVASIS